VLEKAFEKLDTMSQVGNAHDFSTAVHGELGHASIDGPNASQRRNGRPNGAATRTVVADCQGVGRERGECLS
jgi:hypothetical protein